MPARSEVGGLASVRAKWETLASLVTEHRDLIDDRPAPGGPVPQALSARGWAEFLLSLDDAELAAIEVAGADARWPERTPPELWSLAASAREACALPALSAPTGSARRIGRRETPRKSVQVDVFCHVVSPLAARARRVVDVGSGHGHLTRALAVRIGRPVVGLERDRALADRARSLSTDTHAVFTVTDVLRDGLALSDGDCVVGLHACGELGDAMVESAARSPGATLAMVGCCLQKRRQVTRRPLCAAPTRTDALDLPRASLGLSNLVATDGGVEATRAENLAGRARRLALHRLLSEHEGPLRFGAESEGLNRRVAQRGLRELVARAFARRSLPAPPASAVEAAEAWGRCEHARVRRLSVPRSLFARVLEVYAAIDRALYLERAGRHVGVGVLFPATVSPRNVGLFAW